VADESDAEKVARFQAALDQFIERIAEDRYVLAVVLVGSLSPETIWHRESLGLWVIEADGVSRRLLSDGKDERVFRILVENGINLHAEVIPRSRFKQMVEGARDGQQRRHEGPGAGIAYLFDVDDPRRAPCAKTIGNQAGPRARRPGNALGRA
jgi:hypothetical protein